MLLQACEALAANPALGVLPVLDTSSPWYPA